MKYKGPTLLAKVCCLFALIQLSLVLQAQPEPNGKSGSTMDNRTLVVFFDGLRPDYITAQGMPNLFAFKAAGSYGDEHHSVFPTVTRVNSASLSTGCYPAKTGLMGNTVYFPEVNKTKGLNTGDAANLIRINEATGGKLLTAVTLGEILQSAVKKMMVFSSGSSGQAFLQNHTISGGAVINTSIILPVSLKDQVVADLGPIPPTAKPNTKQHQWITDALIKYGLAPDGPLVSAIWFSDPDGSAHSDGIGSVGAMAAIRSVDEQFGRILRALKSKNLTDRYNIIVSTDHGFVTHKGKSGLSEFLIREGLKKDTTSEDVIVAEGAIYVKDHDPGIIKKIVAKLQSQPWIGAIFTRGAVAGGTKGTVAGTLSFETIHWNHPQRAADILADENWDDSVNSAGYAGYSEAKGVAGHGSLSPYEIHIPLILSGPSFRDGFQSSLPTSNVDIAPTILQLHRIPVPSTMDGRVLWEFFAGTKPDKQIVKTEMLEVTAPGQTGYRLQLSRTLFGNHQYVNYAKVKMSGGGLK